MGLPDAFASVRWFGIPQYTRGCKLVVRIDDRDVYDTTLSSVIALDDVDPCRIIVEIDGDGGNGMHVMRFQGWDTIKPADRPDDDGVCVCVSECQP